MGIGSCLVAGWCLAFGDPTPIVPGDPFEVTLDATDPVTTFTWTSDFSGSIVLWATSDEVDPRLKATPSMGEPKEDDNGGGGKAACLVLPTEPGVGGLSS